MQPAKITFQPLTRGDFPLLAHWLAEPLVARWWHHQTSPEAIERDFGPSIDGADVTELFQVALASASRPIGLVQRYPIAAYPEYVDEFASICRLPAGALSIDYLIGEPSARGHGHGATLISAFVAQSWAAHPQARDVIVPVCAANTASWRALERAGFQRIAEGEMEPDNPAEPRDHVVYRVGRAGTG